ncbi:MAG: glycine cleavage system protein H [Deltaproteobacteria bacterium RIFCSPLOWO2_01_44_7]|nr:MAG: glycine cleavage system protein H [Deltaproteobacteria bacterium RIFCSPHIGHO2_01_FULL_43_49]OGQ16468.1 MAG: glycine cleavage system protein H [Deltaproteobacteria bacterium RIFCSPHIGHO2_02_FULL_44_53]OGQ27704.1 MAG: glycine cleavage system protein H [Deltaproteobacteria bacterium RIFCSPHIGHO2_12_FULL_44_21]OGQ32986.1 MAG: glycine cleavage system protein H [Deltaproteobacteria bacterium RIFCSPLOWO2_01_FULL_45_74]OGQ41248.1 MAG: glycine cleavage system protein H [Deltaproteobacteria bacte
MEFPEDLKYTKEHEWVKVNGEIATIGITDYAQEQLGDIVYLELPAEGEAVEQGEPFGVVESVKAVSDLYAALSGTVLEINDPLVENPETLNEDCYEEGWLIKIKIGDPKELKNLMDCKSYQAHIKEETA